MLKILGVFFIILACCPLSGCNPPPISSTAISSAGTIGAKLSKPLPKDQHILVLSVLRDIPVDIIRENIFLYQPLGAVTLPADVINPHLTKTMLSTLERHGYHHLNLLTINTSNVLNSSDIQQLTTRPYTNLTISAQQFLTQQIKGRHADILIILTQNSEQPLAFDIKCELSQNNIYHQASIEPHLNLYKILIIDTHSWQILTWITGSANRDLQNTNFCKPLTAYTPRELNDLKFTVTRILNKSVAKDLSIIVSD